MHMNDIESYLQSTNSEIISNALTKLIFLFILGGGITTLVLLLSLFFLDDLNINSFYH